MKNKPNLVLTEQDIRAGVKNPDRAFSKKLKTDLITVLEHMIKNKKSLKIDLDWFEKIDLGCGTYRCVCGWWAYWLDIPIRTNDRDFSIRFEQTLYQDDIWEGFQNKQVNVSTYHHIFFGDSGTLSQRLKLAKALEIK